VFIFKMKAPSTWSQAKKSSFGCGASVSCDSSRT
jgi:hypothetical protein